MLKRRDVPFVTVIGLLPFVLAACNDATSSTDPRTQPPLVRIEAVEISVQSERSFTGIVAARVQSDLGFRVPGKVLERLVDAGQPVKRGQPLMRIDPTDLRLALRAHEEAVAAARARAHQTAEDEVRHRNLLSPGAVSASEYDKAKAAAESARAELKAARAQADVARNEMSYAVLFADADGVVVETLVEPGQVVVAGQVVVRVAHAGRREAVIELPETLRPAIGSTGRATLYGSGLTGSAKTSPVVGRCKPSDSDVRGSVRAGGPSGRRATGLDHLHPDLGRPVRPDAAGTDRCDLRPGQGSRRMAGRRGNASGHLACRAHRRPQ